MGSIWSETVSLAPRETLSRDISAKVAIIGAGLSGILIAHRLKEKGIDAVILEASKIGGGQTKDTTAKITSQHGLIYGYLIERFGKEFALGYAKANNSAIDSYERIIAEHNIECDFIRRPAYLYTQKDEKPLREEYAASRQLGIDCSLTTHTRLPFSVPLALKFKDQASFHPLKFIKALSDDLEIYENTRVLNVVGKTLETNKGRVCAESIVFACHYPIVNVPGFYFMRMHQERSYVLALTNVPWINGMYYSIDDTGYSFRPYYDVLLFGGGQHRTGENKPGGRYDELRNAARRFYPEHRELMHWSAQDAITLDSVPYIGRFSADTPDWYVATGYKKWGMTSAMVAADIISDLITGVNDENAEKIFTPQRFNPSASMRTLMEDMGESVKGLGKRAFLNPGMNAEAITRGHGGIVEEGGDKAGVYRDDEGKLHIVHPVCPHLGCLLEWNPDELTWDCPCHGSRFDYDGKLIDDPAVSDLI